MKKTPWYPADVKPIRAGVYQTDHGHGLVRWSLFQKGTWMFSRPSKEEAANETYISQSQQKPWRGVVKEQQ